jgi:hypothetical protein
MQTALDSTPIDHVIDCDADPYVPAGWKAEHQREGQFKWAPSHVQLYLSEPQKKGTRIGSNKLRKELNGKPVLNANVLDYLLAHQDLIPEEWKRKYVFFWGTVYRDQYDQLCVRGLRWNGCKWRWCCFWLGAEFDQFNPAALRV